MAKTKTFEQNLKSLEEIVAKLEAGDVSLDEAIRLFQKGRTLSRQCEARLREVELKIQKLLEDEDGEPRAESLDGAVDDEDDDAPDDEDAEPAVEYDDEDA